MSQAVEVEQVGQVSSSVQVDQCCGVDLDLDQESVVHLKMPQAVEVEKLLSCSDSPLSTSHYITLIVVHKHYKWS